MKIFIITHPRTGGMILCETLGKQKGFTAFNEEEAWQEKIKHHKNIVVKPVYGWVYRNNPFKKFPEAYFISTNRNIFDIFASYKNRHLTGHLWANLFVWPSKSIFDVVKHYKEFLQLRKQWGAKRNLLVVDFQDLVTNKFKTFEKIFDFLGLEMSSEVRNYITKYISNEKVENYPEKAESISKNRKVNNYKEVLTKKEIEEIKKRL